MARGPLAGASGPGKFSKRTDLPSAYYGEGVETAAIKSQMPLSTTAGEADDRGGRPRTALPPVTPLFAPSQRPDEPATAGIDLGNGLGSSSLMMQSQFANNKVSDSLAELLPYDSTGEISILYQQAIARGM